MVLEYLWRKLRGIDLWTQTAARITSVFRYTGKGGKGRPIPLAKITYRYQDGNGHSYAKERKIGAISRQYVAREGDSFTLWYHPARPGKHWSDEFGIPAEIKAVLLWGCAMLFVSLAVDLLTGR